MNLVYENKKIKLIECVTFFSRFKGFMLKKNINEAKVYSYIDVSNDRIISKCPYYDLCGGCDTSYIRYDKTLEYKKNIVKLFLMIGVFQSIYAILQSYTDFSFIRRHSIDYMAMGLCSNPNFFGSYMVMQLLLIGYIYIYDSKKKYLFIYLLFAISLYIAESTGPVISVILVIIFSMFVIPKKIKKILKLIIILLLSFALSELSLKYVQTNNYGKEFIPSYDISSEVSTIFKTPIKQIGNGRLTIWKNSIPLIKKYWLIGCGLDNFRDAYPNFGGVKIDKAHNVYLQISVTNGVPALIFFLILLFMRHRRRCRRFRCYCR